MGLRVSPLWWPVLALSSPVILPNLLIKNRRFRKNVNAARALNEKRIQEAEKIDLPELTQFELSVLVEHKAEKGFLGSPGVSYIFKTDRGSLLFDLGYGPETPAFASNAAQIGFAMAPMDAVAISHLHPDHMGGFGAVRKNRVSFPPGFTPHAGLPCYLPTKAGADGLDVRTVEKPQMLAAGIASTGPLARSLFLMGWTEEQAIIARVKDKGLVIFTGCGHPTIETILAMVRRLSDEPIYAIGGGLHFPLTDSPLRKPGLKVQMIWGTGKPPWKRISEDDLNRTIEYLNNVNPEYVFLSGHDTCDYALERFKSDLRSVTTVLRAGATYHL